VVCFLYKPHYFLWKIRLKHRNCCLSHLNKNLKRSIFVFYELLKEKNLEE